MIKRLSLLVSVLFAFFSGVVAAQPKMALSVDGRGQVLHYPFYTVLGSYATNISIVNSKKETKAVRVRFLDSKNGRVALEFNLFLSPFDVWVGALVPDPQTRGARLISKDTSCTFPPLTGDGGLFQTVRFTERDRDGKIIDDSYARTTQGFIEVIEMGVVTDPSVIRDVAQVKGVPFNCINMEKTLYTVSPPGVQPSNSAFKAPGGGLSGTATLIDVDQGVDFSYDAVAIENVFTSAQHDIPGQTKPTLEDAQREVLLIDNGRSYSATFQFGFDAVSALYQRSNASNEWVTEAAIGAQTDLVFTFPTKRDYTIACGEERVNPPFSNRFGFCAGGAAEPAKITTFNREALEQVINLPPLIPDTIRLSYAATVYTLNQGNVFSLPVRGVHQSDRDVSSGWIKFSFDLTEARLLRSLPGAKRDGELCGILEMRGLPVIGFGVQKYVNGNVGGVLSNYGGNFVHKYERSIECK
jgi:hypothetical protein